MVCQFDEFVLSKDSVGYPLITHLGNGRIGPSESTNAHAPQYELYNNNYETTTHRPGDTSST